MAVRRTSIVTVEGFGTSYVDINKLKLSGNGGKSAYQSYLDTTTDNPKKTEVEWVASLKGERGEQGIPGPQGNSGVASADGVIVVNNLTEGGTDVVVDGVTKVKVLSAEMGKEIGDALNELQGIDVYTRDAENDHDGKYVNNSTGYFWNANGYSVSRPIHLNAGQTINVHVTGGNNNSCVIAKYNGSSGYSSVNSGSVPYVSGTTEYTYTAPDGGVDVAIGYKTEDGFRATIDLGSQSERNKAAIGEMAERLDGIEIPFDQAVHYTYSNGTLTENSGNLSMRCSTAKLAIADYKHIYYTGGVSTFNGYFCAIFFNSNNEFVGARVFPPSQITNTINGRREAFYVENVDVLENIPDGATYVVLQAGKSDFPSKVCKVVAIQAEPYTTIAVKQWQQDVYGVRGDGVTDDTAALQLMLDSAQGEISLRPSTYIISGTLSVNTTRIRKFNGNGATLMLDTGDDPTMVALSVFGNISDAADPDKTAYQLHKSGFILEDLQITSKAGDNDDMNGDGDGVGIEISKCFMTTIRGCKIYRMTDGLRIKDTNRNFIIDGNHIYSCQNNGLEFARTCDIHQCNVIGNHIAYNKVDIMFDNCKQINNIQIAGNCIETSRIYPINVAEADKRCIYISADSAISQIDIFGQIEISGNTIQGHSGDDSLGPGGDYIIEVVSSMREMLLNITGNHISNSGRYLIGVSGCSDVSIVGNTGANTGARTTPNVGGAFLKLSGSVDRVVMSGNTFKRYYANPNTSMMVDADSAGAYTSISVSNNVGNNTPVNIDGTLDYISVVGNNLRGGSVSVGTATHKQVENNI